MGPAIWLQAGGADSRTEFSDPTTFDAGPTLNRDPNQIQVIDAVEIKPGLGLSEAYRFRYLMYWLAWRDIKVRYSQAYMGIFWALLQPLATVAILSVVLGFLARVPSDGVPYSVFVVCGIVTWTIFSSALNNVSNGLRTNGALLSKIYCSRLSVVLSTMGTPLFDSIFLFSSIVIIVLVQTHALSPLTLLAIPFLLWALVLGAGIGLLFSALSIHYKDVPMVIPIILQIGMFASPVIYPPSLVPDRFLFLLHLNPVATIISGVRWTIYGAPPPDMPALATSGAVSVAIVLWALYYFNEVQRAYTDKM
ncbi:ABC transporter permease [Pannonibacter phragmitetus]|uniref:ABC transporter permease n=1 Tax=Pannonibacter phragmitetus TaxID=121719 RepID=UPI0009E4A755|nr:ABC transporter permease [Pannonibacter phragmitetus]